MKRLDKLIVKIEQTPRSLKSESLLGAYHDAKNNLDKNISSLSDIINKLKTEQLDNLNMKQRK